MSELEALRGRPGAPARLQPRPRPGVEAQVPPSPSAPPRRPRTFMRSRFLDSFVLRSAAMLAPARGRAPPPAPAAHAHAHTHTHAPTSPGRRRAPVREPGLLTGCRGALLSQRAPATHSLIAPRPTPTTDGHDERTRGSAAWCSHAQRLTRALPAEVGRLGTSTEGCAHRGHAHPNRSAGWALRSCPPGFLTHAACRPTRLTVPSYTPPRAGRGASEARARAFTLARTPPRASLPLRARPLRRAPGTRAARPSLSGGCNPNCRAGKQPGCACA